MKRPTQADVARLAGVSRAVVSYVVNGRPVGTITISEETRRRVLDAIREVGYQPDASAQSLRSGRTRSIGVLIPDTHNPHYWQIVRGVENAARPHGYDLFFSSTSLDPERELAGLRTLTRRRVDGLILMVTYYEAMKAELLALQEAQNALVVFGLPADSGLDVDTVESVYAAGAEEMMTHLLALGHRRIGLVFGVAAPTLGQERLEVYIAAHRAFGLTVDTDRIIHTGPRIEDGYNGALQLLDLNPRPTAIVAVNDHLAIGVLRACAERGLRVPEDISVAGYDDIDVSPYLTPPLTTVHGNAEEMGRRAFELLLNRMQHPLAPICHDRMPAQFIARASTGIANPGRVSATDAPANPGRKLSPDTSVPNTGSDASVVPVSA